MSSQRNKKDKKKIKSTLIFRINLFAGASDNFDLLVLPSFCSFFYLEISLR
ncbi:hypothetical protein MmTuc01_1156 [Methanosarcina mazei Tuc01]|uniref:Uncharacterized protein n=1 Tax=Methanosarcina mazei Tuc01 TaxID=1236903 RepID=M1Q2R0_METMZ|nr:hypothetical protein MmTuc01_1156 [Methanosarcina mazei Tuc01]